MTSSFQVKRRILSRGRMPLLSLNELREKSINLSILGKFVNKPLSNSQFLENFFIGQNLKFVHMTHFFLQLLIYWLVFEVSEAVSRRSSRPELLYTKGALKNFAKFIGKHLCQSFFLIMLHTLGLELYLKRDSGTSVFLWILWNF